MTPHTETLWIAKYDPKLDSGAPEHADPYYAVYTLACSQGMAWAALRDPLKNDNGPYRRGGWRVVKVTVEEVK